MQGPTHGFASPFPGAVVVETASRLREIQEDFADEPEVRRRYLSDEVRSTLEKLSPSQRAAFLQSLSELFPAPGSESDPDTLLPVRTPAPENGQEDARLDDPMFLTERLIALTAPDGTNGSTGITPEAREEVGKRLRRAGLAADGSSAAAGIPAEAIEQLRQALRLKSQRLDPGRAIEVLAMLGPVVAQLDNYGWTTLREIAPRQAPPALGDFLAVLAAYIAGDRKVTAADVNKRLERLKALVVALLKALATTPGFTEAIYEPLSPNHIEEVTRARRRTLLAILKEGLNAACWRHYCDHHIKMDRPGEEMRHKIIECIREIDITLKR